MVVLTFKLSKKPKAVKTLIEGFPGFGLVGTITTEFLLQHLKTEQIGVFFYDELAPTVAIHKGKLLHPMSINYSKKHNLVILHTILNTKGEEWRISDAIVKLASQLKVREVLSIEGVNALNSDGDPKVYYYGNKALASAGAELLEEGVIIGVTASSLLRLKNVSCLFAETSSGLPDSKAAAKIIEVLNKHLRLNLNTEPLLKQAEVFENKLKSILQQTAKTHEEADKKALSYLG